MCSRCALVEDSTSAEEERIGAPKRVPTAEDDLGRLRRENAKLKEENEILKKAAIYFARELT